MDDVIGDGVKEFLGQLCLGMPLLFVEKLNLLYQKHMS